MTRASVIDQKIDALLAGKAPADPVDRELALMRDSMAHVFPLPAISELPEDVHLARMMEMAASVTVTLEPVPVRSSRLTRVKAASSRRVAVATLAFTTAFGGAAYAGVLPESLQEVVAQAASTTGFQLLASDSEDLDETSSNKGKDHPEPKLETDDPAGSADDVRNGPEGHSGDTVGKAQGDKDESAGSDDQDEAEEDDASDGDAADSDGDDGDGDDGDRDAFEDVDDDARPNEEADEPEGAGEGENDSQNDDEAQDAEYDQSNDLGDDADDVMSDGVEETED